MDEYCGILLFGATQCRMGFRVCCGRNSIDWRRQTGYHSDQCTGKHEWEKANQSQVLNKENRWERRKDGAVPMHMFERYSHNVARSTVALDLLLVYALPNPIMIRTTGHGASLARLSATWLSATAEWCRFRMWNWKRYRKKGTRFVLDLNSYEG